MKGTLAQTIAIAASIVMWLVVIAVPTVFVTRVCRAWAELRRLRGRRT